MPVRTDRLDERFDQMCRHFETLFDRQRRHTETRFDQMNERFDCLNALIISQTRWLVGTMVAFGTLVTILMAVSQFAP